jgi:hypothetical protein
MYIACHSNSIQTSSSRSKATNRTQLSRKQKAARVLVCVVIMVVIVACSGMFAFQADAHSDQGDVHQEIVIGSGDTLWSIANEHSKPGESVRAYINKIKELNHLDSSMIKQGQAILLP